MKHLARVTEGNCTIEWYDFYGANRARFGNKEYEEPAEIKLIEVEAYKALNRMRR